MLARSPAVAVEGAFGLGGPGEAARRAWRRIGASAAAARWKLLGAGGAVALVLVVWAAGRVAAVHELAQLQRDAGASAALHAEVLRSELEKQRSVPFVLAEDAEVRALLAAGGGARAAGLNARLEALAARTRAAAIYVIDRRGMTVAASNWRRPTSFVGSNYSFRPYFSHALRDGSAEYPALGTVSRIPGLFLARRVDGPGGPLGVVAVKVEFTALEADWRTSSDALLVTNQRNVVVITNRPEWRFRIMGQLTSRQRARMHRAQQFGDAPLSPLPLRPLGRDGVVAEISLVDRPGRSFVQASVPAAAPQWRLYVLQRADTAVRAAVLPAQAIALLVGALCLGALAALLRSLERQAARAARRDAARAELERRVDERTVQLRTANARLMVEVEERRRAEAVQSMLQDDLVQANKLAVLGQIAAGVAHEINQPVAAIRTYAENASEFLVRAQPGPAQKNLRIIAGLTEKIGCITDELRAFSRKTSRQRQPIGLEAAISGALILVDPRLKQQHITLLRETVDPAVRVLAEQIRLEQVLVNLLQNAIEALAGRPAPTIRLSVAVEHDAVVVTVADNGPGLGPDAAAVLFTPFRTSKPNGVGLGLVIVRDIVTDFGGEIAATQADGGGAAFVLTLRRSSDV